MRLLSGRLIDAQVNELTAEAAERIGSCPIFQNEAQK